MSSRVVISGMGIVSSAGANLAEAAGKFIAGTCCLTPIPQPRAARLRARFAGQIGGFQLPAEMPPELGCHDRHVHLALAAARETLDSAGIRPGVLGPRLGLIFSTCSGPMLLIEAHYERILRGDPRLSRAELAARRYGSGAPALARALGVRGLCTTIVTACSASTAAMALAADLIRSGMLDAALAGGADSFSLSTLAGFDGLKATSDGRCAPFSKPTGLNLGEAAAFVLLESRDSARRRGARVRGEILGSGLSNDAHHCSAPEPGGRGLAEAMRRALQEAGLEPDQISYINAHGTGTEANDKAECRAVRKVFGDRTATLPLSSTKSMVGHCLGAAGTVEAIATLVCAEAGVLPPTANFTGPRDGCAVDCVPDAGRAWESPRVFLSNNSAFGGHNASLAVAVPEGVNPRPAFPPSTPVYITACGVVSAVGLGVEALDRARREPSSGLRTITPTGLPPLMAGMVDEAAVEACDRRLNLRSMDRSSKWATVAARMAIRGAKFPEKPAALAELGLFLNLSAGPSRAESEFLTSFLANDHQVTQLAAFPYIVPSSVAGNVCRALMISGHNLTLNPGPGAGLFGLAPALAALRCGHANALLCGAVDELTDRILTDHHLAGGAAPDHVAPPGEGAVMLMLETAPHAEARGVRPLAELCGVATGMKARGTADGDPGEVVAVALDQAGIGPERVGAICYYGPGEPWRGLHPSWPERRVRAGPITGLLEGAQPLLDLAWAMQTSARPPGTWVLLAAVSPQGLTGAAVIKTLETST